MNGYSRAHNFKFKFKKFKFFRLNSFLKTVGQGLFFGIWAGLFGILCGFLMFVPRDVFSLESSHPIAIIFITIGAIGILTCVLIGPYFFGFLIYILVALLFFIGVFIINIFFNLIEIIKYLRLKNKEKKRIDNKPVQLKKIIISIIKRDMLPEEMKKIPK